MRVERRLLVFIRWTARVTSAILAALIALFFLGDDLSPSTDLTAHELVLLSLFLLVWLGLLVGWRWEAVGGLAVVGGTAAFYILEYLFTATFPRGPYFPVIAVPGFLFLYCAAVSSSSESDRSSSENESGLRG